MSDYVVSARKYRPATFATVVGQEALTTTLRNSIASGRLAHAYLFCGPRGVGKTTCARIFAKTINCLSPKPNHEACEECESCRAFNEQRSLNIHELDAASNNSVDNIRQLIDQVAIPPQLGKYKVYIVDEVHMLSTAAFNAFLKTLEEPPSYAIFILATTEKHKLLPTILSRCQIYDFSRIRERDMVRHLAEVASQEGITYEPEALSVIAQKADGGMRDALSIFDQVASFCQGHITYEQTLADLGVLSADYYFRMVDALLAVDVSSALLTLEEVLSKGFDGSLFMGGLNSHLRHLLMSRDERTLPLLDVSEEMRRRYGEQSRRCQPKWLYKAIRRGTNCDIHYRQSQNKRLLVEITLIEMAQDASESGGDDGASGLSPTQQSLQPLRPHTAPSAPVPPEAPSTGGGEPRSSQPAAPPPAGERHPPSPKKGDGEHGARGGQSTSVFSVLGGGFVGKQAAAPASAIPASVPGAEQLPLTQENLAIAWRELVQQLPPEMKASARRLENVVPHLSEGSTSFEAAADNPSLEHLLREVKPRMEAYLRTRFATPPAMVIRVRPESERPKMLSPREQLTEMSNENPALPQLIQRFSLTME